MWTIILISFSTNMNIFSFPIFTQEDILSTPVHITAVDCGIDAHERDMVSEISYSTRHTRIQYLHLLDYLFSTFPHLNNIIK